MVASGKKLLVLDLNGLLVDTYYEGETRPDRAHDAKVNKFYVYERPFCNEFIEFCLENFIVGIWSSALGNNVNSLVEYLFKDTKQKLAFVWHQQHCTDTGFRHPDNKFKPVFLKELWRLWTKAEPDLPWEAGDYGPENTLLIDDAPYKAINNPPHTAIFPKTYRATDLEDCYLDAELQVYLEGLLECSDVQKYLQEHPIGEPSIVIGVPQWHVICSSVKVKNERENRVPVHMVATIPPVPAVAPDPVLPSSEKRKTVGKKFDQRSDRVLAPMKYSRSRSRDSPARRGAYEESHWEQRPDHVKGDHESRHFGWRSGFPESHGGPSWSRGPRSDDPAHLVGVPGSDPFLSSDWQRRGGKGFGNQFNQRLDHIAAGQAATHGNLGPLNFSMPHPGSADAQARRMAFEDGHWERPGLGPQLKGDHESRNFAPSGWGPENHPGPSWAPGGPRSNDTTHLLGISSDPGLSSDWPRREDMKFAGSFDQRLDHSTAQTIPGANGNFLPGSHNIPIAGDAQGRRIVHEDSQWERPAFVAQPKGDYESQSLAPSGWGSGFSGTDTGPSWPIGLRSNEAPHLIGSATALGPDPPLSEWRTRAGKKFGGSMEQRLEHNAAETVPDINGHPVPVNLSMPRDVQARRLAYDDGQLERPGLHPQQKGNYESRGLIPSGWGGGGPEVDAGPSWSHGTRPGETGHLVGGIGPDPLLASDWQRRAGKNFAGSFDQSLEHMKAETAQGVGNLNSANLISTPRMVSDVQTHRRIAHDDNQWERPDLVSQVKGEYEGRSSGWRGGLESHAGPPWSSRPTGNETGHPLLVSDYPSQKQSLGRLRDYESVSRGGDRLRDDYLGREVYNRKRTRDFEDTGRGWSVEGKDPQRGWTREFNRGGPRDLEDYYRREDLRRDEDARRGEDPRRGWSMEYKDSKRGRSAELNRDGGRGPRELALDDRRAVHFNDDRSPVFRRRDRLMVRELEEPYSRHHRGSPGHDYRTDGSEGRARMRDGRDLQRYSDRDNRGHGNRFEDFRSSKVRMLEREDVKASSRSLQKYDHVNGANQSRSSKRRPV